MPATRRSTRSIRAIYGLPRQIPVAIRLLGFMVAVALVWVVAWLVLPDGPVTVVGLALLVLLMLFAGLGRVTQSPQLEAHPGRHPMRPPSAHGVDPPRSR